MVNIVRSLLGLDEEDGKEIAKAVKKVKKAEKKAKAKGYYKIPKAEKPKKDKPNPETKAERVEVIRKRIESRKETKE